MRLIQKLVLFTLCLFTANLSWAGSWKAVNSDIPAASKAVVLSSDIQSSTVQLQLQGYFLEPVMTPAGKSWKVTSPGGSQLLEAGAPDLPKFAVSLIIPETGAMEVEILAADYIDIPGMSIAPSKGNLSRTVNPSEVSFTYGDAYTKNEFWPVDQAALRAPYILRDYRGQTLLFKPFQFNPSTGTLRIFTSMTVKVMKKAGKTDVNALNRPRPLTSIDGSFGALYKDHFANFPNVAYAPLNETPKLLVICPQNWQSLIQPLVDWKIKKGIETTVVDVLTAGGTSANIQTYIANQYLNNGIGYVLLVGDVDQVPTITAQGGASDPSYGYILGSDSYAEVIIGRFSAETDADVATQVQRVLDYELNPNPSLGYYSKGVAIGSNQGPGDDGEMDWEHEVNIRTDLMNFTYTNVAELYDGTHPGTSDAAGDPSNTDLFNLFQSGIGIMTYTGHGSSQSCSTTGLSNNDIQNMTNVGQLPFIWAVACVNGEFNMPGAPCFAEKFLRAQVNGQPTGAVATYMSSINQSWDPPMDAQDEMVDILVQSYPTNMKYTFGGISVNGCMHMNDNYGAAGNEMTDTWHCFGDPTLNVRTAVPQVQSVSHTPTLPVGTGSLLINGSFNGATVALTMNGQIIGTGVVSNGNVLIAFSPVQTPDTIFVTVTGFNQLPYTGQVLIIPATGPYVIYQSSTVHDPSGNGDGLVDFSEQIDVDLTLQNVGLADANAITATLTTSSPYITITNGTATIGSIVSGNSFSLQNAFQYTVANNVPDQTSVQFTIQASDGLGNSWTSSFFTIMNAPVLAGGNINYNDVVGGDGDGYLEPGESATVTIRCLNNGHSDAPATMAAISTISPFLTISSATYSAGTIGKASFIDATFQVSLANNVAVGTSFDILLTMNSAGYMANKLYTGTAGIILEDFETGNFNRFNWNMGGNAPWLITNVAPFEGTYSAVSSIIGDNQTADLIISLTAMADDSLTFWYKTSSEENWDFLRLTVDANSVGAWSGDGAGWLYTGFLITAGSHTVTFSYEKDVSYTVGDDRAWLDNIRFPMGTQVTSVQEVITQNGVGVWPNPGNGQFNILLKEPVTEDFAWTVVNLMGSKVAEGILNAGTAENSTFSMDLSTLANGMYILQLQNSAEQMNVKLQINR